MTLHSDAVRTLTRWHPTTDQQRDFQETFLTHLGAHGDALSRTCHPDHITASAVVVSADRRQVLLNLHRKYRIWVQFGGHCEESDGTVAAAALRETVEESGIADLRLLGDGPVQLDVHEVRCGPVRPSHHLDIRYLVEASHGAVGVASDESLDVRWFDRSALPAGVDPSVRELVDRCGSL